MDRQERRVMRLREHVLGHAKKTDDKTVEAINKFVEEKEDPYSSMIQAAISEDMEELTVKELKDIAKSIKIENYSTMNKDELIDAISKV